jgi:transposase
MRYELTDHEWTAIKPMLPNKPRTRSVSKLMSAVVRIPRWDSNLGQG